MGEIEIRKFVIIKFMEACQIELNKLKNNFFSAL